MVKYTHWIYGAILIISITFIVVLYRNNQILNNRLDTLSTAIIEKAVVDKLTSEKTFKEDFYIKQQSSDTTLILTCFGLGFALFSFFTYQSVVGLISDEVKKIKDDYVTHEKNYNIQHKQLIKIEKSLLLQTAYLYRERAISYHDKNDLQNFVQCAIISCESFSKILDLLLEEESDYKDSVVFALHDLIRGTKKNIDRVELPLIIKDFNEPHFRTRINTILKQLKDEKYFEFCSILEKLKFEKYEFKFE